MNIKIDFLQNWLGIKKKKEFEIDGRLRVIVNTSSSTLQGKYMTWLTKNINEPPPKHQT